MVGSPNYFIGVYDADQSSYNAPAGVPIPNGSVQIENVFESYYTQVGEPYDDAEFSGRSDYQAFILMGIPASGLFTGAEVTKTAEQAGIWGGTAGAPFDPCYHQACDTLANNSKHALEVNSDAIAFAVLTFAYSTEAVNGFPGSRCATGQRTDPGLARGGRIAALVLVVDGDGDVTDQACVPALVSGQVVGDGVAVGAGRRL